MILLRIENLLLNNINLNNSDNFFKEGSFFKGEILEIFEEFVLIDIPGKGIIKATVDSEVNLTSGNELNFIVKSAKDDKIEIKPFINEELSKNTLPCKVDSSISKILEELNIPEDELSIDLVENLMKYNVPVNKKNILEGIKILEKLIELTSLESEDKVVVFENKNLDENKNTIKGELIYKKDLGLPKKPLVQNIIDDYKEPEKINIKNLLVVDKNSYPEKEDLTNLIREFLGTETKIENKEINKIFSFFSKHDIEPSLNNIKNIREFINNPIKFSKELIQSSMLLKEEIEGKEEKMNFNKIRNFSFNQELKKDDIEDIKKDLKLLEKIEDKTDSKSVLGPNIKKEINDLENKIDFLKEMDEDLTFLFLPITYGQQELDGVLTLLKDNKNKKSTEDKINIFINLDTNNLGNIKISCIAKQENLSVKMNIQKSDLKLFQSAEEGLIDRIKALGYITDKIEFIADDDLNLMDTIATNPNPNYFLDIKV